MPLARTQVQVGLAPTDLRVHEGAGSQADWGFKAKPPGKIKFTPKLWNLLTPPLNPYTP